MKKLLILGGTYFQIPAIKYAKSRGYYVITCDYLPENPGHKFSDEYYNISTTDKDAVLELSKSLNIDGILCFASDPAALTAAYVSEKLDLPGNSYEIVQKLAEKHYWRNFLSQNGFNTPTAKSYINYEDCIVENWKYPIMIKPIDSSGSKGVTKVDNSTEIRKAFEYANKYSRAKMLIVEEFIEKVGCQIGGDGLYGIDKLEFVCFGDQIVDETVNKFVPCGMKFPSEIPETLKNKIRITIESALKKLNVKNLSFNLEVMLDKYNNIYLMEIGPRNGGNCIPETINYYSNVDLVALAVEASLGNNIKIKLEENKKHYAYYALHSKVKGVYNGYEFAEDFIGKLLNSYIFIEKGNSIDAFNGSNQTIGILILEFENKNDINDFFLNTEKYIKVKII